VILRMSDVETLTPQQRAVLPRLIRQAVVIADYGLAHDGCPFCGRIVEHERDCVVLEFGATRGRVDEAGLRTSGRGGQDRS
jgi:hypothetical protein